MILILGGTTEGRELATLLKGQGYQCVLSVASGLGREFAIDLQGLICGELNYGRLTDLIEKGKFRVILDATHPYAEQIKITAQRVAREKGLTYLRYQRPAADLPKGPNLFRVGNYATALRILEQSAGGIFLTIGVRQIHLFRSLWSDKQCRVWVKVLPVSESLDRCLALGLRPEQIYAFHGAGSKEILTAILRETGAGWLVTKESGNTGGILVKVDAALELGRKVLVIDRPPVETDLIFDNYDAILEWLAKEKPGMEEKYYKDAGSFIGTRK